jgi:uncharacterized protein
MTEMALEYFYFLQAEVSLYKQTGNYRISYLTVSGLFIPCFICRSRMLNSNPINEEEMKMTVEALRKDMVAAMKAKDKTTKEAVSALISAAKKAAIDEGCRDDIPEALVDRVILKELKTVKEQLDTCPESREDLRAEYQARYDVIAKYAPQQMSAEEIKTYLEEKFAEVLATKNKGQIMKAVMGDLKGKADGKLINQVVAEFCK